MMAEVFALIAENDQEHITDLEMILKEISPTDCKVEISHACDAYDAIKQYEYQRRIDKPFDVLFIDLVRFDPERVGGGTIILKKVFEIEGKEPKTKLVPMSAYDNQYEVVGGIAEEGTITDFLNKPLDRPECRFRIRRIIKEIIVEQRVITLQQVLKRNISKYLLEGSLGKGAFYEKIKRFAKGNISILIQGESGTGKELIANAIHKESQRANEVYLVVNCAAIPENLLESELFGHEKGAFTGAHTQKQGLFEIANGGTLFLDEIGDLSKALQAKLLRALEQKEIMRVGGTRQIKVNVRIISATHQDLDLMVKEDKFRQDLYFRLNGFTIYVPALRDRPEDIESLANYFLKNFRQVTPDCHIKRISSAAMKLLKTFSWPGNARQLKQAIEHASTVCETEEIQAEDLPEYISNPEQNNSLVTVGWKFSGQGINKGISLRREIDKFELLTIKYAEQHGWKATEIEAALGIKNLTNHIKLRVRRNLPELESELPDLVKYFIETRSAIRKLYAPSQEG